MTSARFEVCILFSFDTPDGSSRTCSRGEVLRGDDIAYRAGAPYCCELGTPHAERPALADFSGDGHTTHRPRRRPDGWRRGDDPDAWSLPEG